MQIKCVPVSTKSPKVGDKGRCNYSRKKSWFAPEQNSDLLNARKYEKRITLAFISLVWKENFVHFSSRYEYQTQQIRTKSFLKRSFILQWLTLFDQLMYATKEFLVDVRKKPRGGNSFSSSISYSLFLKSLFKLTKWKSKI